jgi:dTDP-4-amino-4,6-dideoxygalactose transaminase
VSTAARPGLAAPGTVAPGTVAFHRPSVSEEDIEAVAGAMRSGWLTQGPLCRRFEEAVAARLGARHAVSVSSGTTGLELALAANGIGPGDEVVTTTLTYCATAQAIERVGATPVLVDVLPGSLQMDPRRAEEAVTPRTRALLPVHLGGHVGDPAAIAAVADRHGLEVVVDAAHAFGTTVAGRPVGSTGRATVFSFYPTKPITTGEGGMVVTDADPVSETVRLLRAHGTTRDTWSRDRDRQWRYDVVAPGFKANLSDPQAALGLSQLAREPELRARRAEIAARYLAGLAPLGLVTLPRADDGGQASSWHLFAVQLRLERLRLDRDEVAARLQDAGVATAVHYIPVHLFHHFATRYGYRPGDLPVAEAAFERLLSLPIYPLMTDADVEQVLTQLIRVLETARAD